MNPIRFSIRTTESWVKLLEQIARMNNVSGANMLRRLVKQEAKLMRDAAESEGVIFRDKFDVTRQAEIESESETGAIVDESIKCPPPISRQQAEFESYRSLLRSLRLLERADPNFRI